MNERFKFRGKRLDNNEWYYGSYLFLHNADKFDWNGTRHSTNEDVHYIIDENDVNYAINPKTVGQCTGLKDKNGKLIYEGDILGGTYENLDIFYCPQCMQFELHCKGYGCMSCNGDVHWSEVVEDNNELEVIGNIYENKELLEDTEQN